MGLHIGYKCKCQHNLVYDVKSQHQPVVEASMAAIQTAALIPSQIRGNNNLGKIVLTAKGSGVAPDPELVFLGGGSDSHASNLVHPRLQTDPETLDALKKLGIKPASAETVFKEAASELLRAGSKWTPKWKLVRKPDSLTMVDYVWSQFWKDARGVAQLAAVDIIKSHTNWRDALGIRTVTGKWRTLFDVLLPGPIVPTDGSRDGDLTIDIKFHEAYLPVLKQLGAVSAPCAGHELSPVKILQFTNLCRDKFKRQGLRRNPRPDKLNFENTTTSGPLDVLESLSDEGKALYTWELLALEDTYDQWMMRHDTQHDIYPSMAFETPALETLRKDGRIRTDNGIYRLSDGLGTPPKNRAVLDKLLTHPNSEIIRRVFGIEMEINARLETSGEDGPVPLTDIWPGLEAYLPAQQAKLELIRCDQIFRSDEVRNEVDCASQDGFVYVTRWNSEEDELEVVLHELGLTLSGEQVEKILRRQTSLSIQEARREVRA